MSSGGADRYHIIVTIPYYESDLHWSFTPICILYASCAWIRLVPEKDELGIFLERDLAAMLVFATNKKNAIHHPDAGVLDKFLVQDSLVAGEGNQRYLRLMDSKIPRLAA